MNGLSPNLFVQHVALALVGLVAMAAGGEAGWTGRRRAYRRMTWFVVFFPTTSYFVTWLALLDMFLRYRHMAEPPTISFVGWHSLAFPLTAVCVGLGWALGWALKWLTFCFCKVVPESRDNSV